MSSSTADEPDTYAARRHEDQLSFQFPPWTYRSLTVKDGLIVSCLLLPVAYLPYFLLRRRLDVITQELIHLRSASSSFANELRTVRIPEQAQATTSTGPSDRSLYSIVRRNEERHVTVLNHTVKILSMLLSAKDASIRNEAKSVEWQSKTSDLIWGLYALGRARCVAIHAETLDERESR